MHLVLWTPHTSMHAISCCTPRIGAPCGLSPYRRCLAAERPTHITCVAANAYESSNGTNPSSQGPWHAWKSWWSVIPEASKQSTTVSVVSALSTLFKLVKRRDAIWIGLGLVLLVGGALCELAVPHFVSKIFAAIIAATSDGTLAANAARMATFSLPNCAAVLATCPALVSALACLVLVSVGEGIFNAGRSACLGVVNHRLVGSLRDKVFQRLISQEVMFFYTKDNNAAALSSRLSSDCLAVTKLLTLNLNVMLRQGLQGVGGLVYLAFMSVPLAIGCTAATLLMGCVCIKYGTVLRRAMTAMQDALAESTSVAEEALSSIRIVRSMGYEPPEGRRYRLKLQSVINIGIRITAAHVIYMFTHTYVWYTAKLFILACGGAYALGGVLTPAQLTAFVMYVDHVLYNCLSVCEQFASVLESVGATSTVLRLLQLPPAPQVAGGVTPDESVFEAGITFSAVSYAYPSRPIPALDSVSLTLPHGSSTAVVGRSGSGKSTLVQLLTRQADPSSGTVEIGSHDLRDVDSAWFRSHLSIVPQEPGLFSTTVYQNIAYGVEDRVTAADVEAAARAANAHEFIEKLPQGYGTFVSDGLLSGGQRQRIAIARALVRNPRLMVLDEATSSLDAESEGAVQEALQDIMADRSRTVVVISHRLSTIRECDQIVVLDAGRVAEVGTHAALMRRRNGIYRDLVTQQNRGNNERVTRVSDVEREGFDDSARVVHAAAHAGHSNGVSVQEDGTDSTDIGVTGRGEGPRE